MSELAPHLVWAAVALVGIATAAWLVVRYAGRSRELHRVQLQVEGALLGLRAQQQANETHAVEVSKKLEEQTDVLTRIDNRVDGAFTDFLRAGRG